MILDVARSRVSNIVLFDGKLICITSQDGEKPEPRIIAEINTVTSRERPSRVYSLVTSVCTPHEFGFPQSIVTDKHLSQIFRRDVTSQTFAGIAPKISIVARLFFHQQNPVFECARDRAKSRPAASVARGILDDRERGGTRHKRTWALEEYSQSYRPSWNRGRERKRRFCRNIPQKAFYTEHSECLIGVQPARNTSINNRDLTAYVLLYFSNRNPYKYYKPFKILIMILPVSVVYRQTYAHPSLERVATSISRNRN